MAALVEQNLRRGFYGLGFLGLLVLSIAVTAGLSSSHGRFILRSMSGNFVTSATTLLTSITHSFTITSNFNQSNVSAPACTCGVKRLSGIVDDCCCEYETVDSLNLDVLQPLLSDLVKQPFFRYFKVRLWCDCPFWREEGMCHSRDCSVGECAEDEIPGPLRSNGGSDVATSAGSTGGAPGEADPSSALGSVDRTVDRSAFLAWAEEDNPWTHDDEDKSEESSYVNLMLNPERYTGYKGESARRIWQAIYQESCFQDGPNDTCRERRVFYRLISGFHVSITVHVSTSFLHNSERGEWGPHLEMFRHRVANFPDRLSNLYFTFLFVLRAAMKASDCLSHASYDTGNPAEDARTLELVRSLVTNHRLHSACPVPFDEAQMWKGVEGPQLFHTLQAHFRNISAIMDCVGCERCRLWGKLEMLGLATALKILFSIDGSEPRSAIALQRNEVTALVNTLWRFSEALKSSAQMMSLLEAQPEGIADKAGRESHVVS